MATTLRQSGIKKVEAPARRRWYVRVRILSPWMMIFIALMMLVPGLFDATLAYGTEAAQLIYRWARGIFAQTSIAPLFTEQVRYWDDEIAAWSETYGVDANLLATVMQIESCGHPNVSSSAGAQGLFQVMPFHFAEGESMLDPDTNAMRGANFLKECSGYANGDIGLTLACYNGGPSVTRKPFWNWPQETQRYYTWGTGIYQDAASRSASSQTLSEWLTAGGAHLCGRASSELGLQ